MLYIRIIHHKTIWSYNSAPGGDNYFIKVFQIQSLCIILTASLKSHLMPMDRHASMSLDILEKLSLVDLVYRPGENMEIPGSDPESSSNLLCGLPRVISYSVIFSLERGNSAY